MIVIRSEDPCGNCTPGREADMDVSSIASMSMHMAQTDLMQSIGTAVLDMALDTDLMQGQSAASILESSVNPDIGSNIDISV